MSEKMRDALLALVKRAERETCQHETTHRGGVLWTICDSCGRKWADDEGGKPEFTWPKEIIEARAALAAEGESGWRDIATAPRDGHVILLFALTDTETGNWKIGTGYAFGDKWVWENHRLRPYDTAPTHWQPLPAPPSPKDKTP